MCEKKTQLGPLLHSTHIPGENVKNTKETKLLYCIFDITETFPNLQKCYVYISVLWILIKTFIKFE